MSEPKRRPGRPPKPGSRAWMIRQAEDAEAAGLPPPGPPVSAPAAAALAAAPAAAAATAPSSPDETDAARYSSEMKDLESRVQDSLDSVWETESLFEDALEDLAEDKFFVDGKPFFCLSVQVAWSSDLPSTSALHPPLAFGRHSTIAPRDSLGYPTCVLPLGYPTCVLRPLFTFWLALGHYHTAPEILLVIRPAYSLRSSRLYWY